MGRMRRTSAVNWYFSLIYRCVRACLAVVVFDFLNAWTSIDELVMRMKGMMISLGEKLKILPWHR